MTEGEDEPVLGSVVAADQTRWVAGNQDDREGDGCADDREGDELQHSGEAVNEDDEESGDKEPSLGWTVDGLIQNTGGMNYDAEAGPSARPPQNRTVLEGSALGVESTFRRALHGLSDRSKKSIRSRIRTGARVTLI